MSNTDTEPQVTYSEPTYIDDGLLARPERIAVARAHWIEGQAEDFEQTRKHRWRDKATGRLYKRVHGTPFLGSPGSDIELWFVQDGAFVCLTHADRDEATLVEPT